jgi:hypothetical protein
LVGFAVCFWRGAVCGSLLDGLGGVLVVTNKVLIWSTILGTVGLTVLVLGYYFFVNWWRDRKLMEYKEPKREPFYVYAKEGKFALETFVSEDVDLLPNPYKTQLSAFLGSVLEDLNKKIDKKGLLQEKELKPPKYVK